MGKPEDVKTLRLTREQADIVIAALQSFKRDPDRDLKLDAIALQTLALESKYLREVKDKILEVRSVLYRVHTELGEILSGL